MFIYVGAIACLYDTFSFICTQAASLARITYRAPLAPERVARVPLLKGVSSSGAHGSMVLSFFPFCLWPFGCQVPAVHPDAAHMSKSAVNVAILARWVPPYHFSFV